MRAGAVAAPALHSSRVAKDTSLNDFGLLIAYVLPGFTAIWATTMASYRIRLNPYHEGVTPWEGFQ